MSAADRFADEISNATHALTAVHATVSGLSLDGSHNLVQYPGALAHAMSNFRHLAAEVEFTVYGLYRRAARASVQDTYPDAVRDLATDLASGLYPAHGCAHATWRVLERVEAHAYAIKTANRSRAQAGSAATDRFAAETTDATNALSAAHTILAGLSQDYYGGRAVLNADILAHAVTQLRECTALLETTLPVVGRHATHPDATAGYPDAVGEQIANLATDLTAATRCARSTTRLLRGLETHTQDLKKAAHGTPFSL